jgi:hypothetical protein
MNVNEDLNRCSKVEGILLIYAESSITHIWLESVEVGRHSAMTNKTITAIKLGHDVIRGLVLAGCIETNHKLAHKI